MATKSTSLYFTDDEIIFSNMPYMVIEKAANMIAEKFVEANYVEIAKLIDVQALANMTIANAGAKINETLNKKMPDKILQVDHVKKEIYQKSIFGGLRRVG